MLTSWRNFGCLDCDLSSYLFHYSYYHNNNNNNCRSHSEETKEEEFRWRLCALSGDGNEFCGVFYGPAVVEKTCAAGPRTAFSNGFQDEEIIFFDINPHLRLLQLFRPPPYPQRP